MNTTLQFPITLYNNDSNISNYIVLLSPVDFIYLEQTGPDEMREAPKFATRHLANTHLSHVDVEAVSYLGYLPQDMIGRSIFDFYHPEDLPLLKEIYESGRSYSGGLHTTGQLMLVSDNRILF